MSTKMPDRVRELLNSLIQDCQDMDKDLDFVNLSVTQARSALLKVVLECVPEEEKYNGCDCEGDGECSCSGRVSGHNSCRSQVIEAMERLFRKEIV